MNIITVTKGGYLVRKGKNFSKYSFHQSSTKDGRTEAKPEPLLTACQKTASDGKARSNGKQDCLDTSENY